MQYRAGNGGKGECGLVPFQEISLVVAGLTVSVMAARNPRHDTAGYELLGNQVYRPADPEDHLDAVLLEEFHCTGPHASCNHVGHFMGCQVGGQDSGLVAGTLQHLPVEYDAVLD